MYNELSAYLAEKDVKYKGHIKLSEYSSVRIGGDIEIGIFPHTEQKLISVLSYLKEMSISFALFGNMTNVLADDSRFRGAVVFTRGVKSFRLNENVALAECGVSFSALISKMAEHSLGGLEPLFGIPGTVGGMIYSNAGAFGMEIADVLLYVRAYDIENNEVLTISKEDLGLSYRHSLFKDNKNLFILDAAFKFAHRESDKIFSDIRAISEVRRRKQPIEYPSLGSVFKRRDGIIPAKLIDESSLRGYRIGGAEVSEKHAGFIVNKGGATAGEFKCVVEHVKKTISQKYGVNLEEEIEYFNFLP